MSTRHESYRDPLEDLHLAQSTLGPSMSRSLTGKLVEETRSEGALAERQRIATVLRTYSCLCDLLPNSYSVSDKEFVGELGKTVLSVHDSRCPCGIARDLEAGKI